jgi:hypothetical protein
MKRQAPWLFKALQRVPRLWETMGSLFGERTTFWEGDNKTDLTNKAYLGLLQAEVEEIAARVQKIEESLEGLPVRFEWRLLLQAKDSFLYQSLTGELATVPLELVDVLLGSRAFEGEVQTHDKYLRFSVGEDVLADIPRSLVLQLRGFEPDPEGEETEGERAEGGES